MTKHRLHVTALIPAAGSGTRMGGQRKQYRLLGDESLLMHTLRLFDGCDRVSSIIVAAPEDDAAILDTEVRARGIRKLETVVKGGRSRQQSVAAALDAAADTADVVLVHDAVRPFLAPDRIDAVIDAVEEHGAAALAIPAKDTLRRVRDGAFAETVPREELFRMQTPQGFRTDWFVEAHSSARRENIEATDDVALVERLGATVRLVDGSALNFKVTTSEDWVLAQALWHHLKT